MREEQPLDALNGIGEKTKQIFARAGILDVGDLLCYFPRAYEKMEPPADIAAVRENEVCAVIGALERPLKVINAKGLVMTSGVFRDATGAVEVCWYHMPYLKSSLKSGVRYVFRGKTVKKKGRLLLLQPAVYAPEEYRKLLDALQPVYPLTAGLTQNMLTRAVRQVLADEELTGEFLPREFLEKYRLEDYRRALWQIHSPKDEQSISAARRRLVFNEFFFFILSVRALRERRQKAETVYRMTEPDVVGRVIGKLDFSLTGAQQRVWDEIRGDFLSGQVGARLIQGDVGSGKTILAFLAMLFAAGNGCQSAIMAPTEVLAAQHFETMTQLLKKMELPYHAVLLTGSMTAGEKKKARGRIEAHEADIVIGTHALFQEAVLYDKLALVITDEQHRFGVRQREAFGEKGRLPHTLVMSATPIPRTLAVILYGDLDISVVDELPANRLPVKTCVVDTRWRPKAYAFILREVQAGRQAYVICPMVEESENVEAENVLAYAETLRGALPSSVCVEVLHGRMKPQEKNAVMGRFLENRIQVLVSTTVVEVGVNVPNATVMMIENAERFGLAQLHQLRGRVGRGAAQSYCILVYGHESRRTRERLEILRQSNDGFFIASEDLRLRGPGDLFGVRQSGDMAFRIGDPYRDAQTLKEAGEAADIWLSGRKSYEEAYPSLAEKARRYGNFEGGKINL